MTSIDKLLAPLTGDNPCGIDLSYDPALQALEVELQGKPETPHSQAEEPDWKVVREHCLALLAKSKDLRLAVDLSLALLQTEGLAGFLEGIHLVRGLVETYWDKMYPALDPEDPDPIQRANILKSLTTRTVNIGAFQDPYRFLDRLSGAPLCQAMKLGRAITFSDVEHGRAGTGELSPSQLDAAFREADAEGLVVTATTVAQTLAHIKALDQWLTNKIGANAPDWTELEGMLAGMQRALAPFVGGQVAAGDGRVVESGGATAEDTGRGAVSAPGTIETRRDVVQAIDRICQYYSRKEPSSPVPLLLRRAQRLVDKDFMAIIEDIAVDALPQVRSVTGQKVEGSAGAEGEKKE